MNLFLIFSIQDVSYRVISNEDYKHIIKLNVSIRDIQILKRLMFPFRFRQLLK